MADFLSWLHHLPCGSKDGFIALLLPERDVERSGKLPSTSRVFQTEFRGMIVLTLLNRLLLRWFHVIKGISRWRTDEERE